MSDETNKHLREASAIELRVRKIFDAYETSKILPANDSRFDHIIGDIKTEKGAIDVEVVAITDALMSIKDIAILDRVFLEFARIMCTNYDDALDKMAYQILAFKAGVTEFKRSFFSEQINLSETLLKERFDEIMQGLIDVDEKIKLIMSHEHKEEDLYNELYSLSKLNQTTHETIEVKTELYRFYLVEVEKAHATNQELNILQQIDAEMNIEMTNWLYQFATTYQQLILRLINH